MPGVKPDNFSASACNILCNLLQAEAEKLSASACSTFKFFDRPLPSLKPSLILSFKKKSSLSL